MLKKYNLIILAGGEDEAWCHPYGYKRKAFLPLLDKPMLSWVIEAFRKSRYIDNIIVIGPKGLNQFDSMRYVRKYLLERRSLVGNLFYAALYVKAVINKFSHKHNGYLISFCDAPFLNTSIIDATLRNMSQHTPEIALHYVKRETIAKRGFPAENRSYIQVAQKYYTGSNLYYIKSIRTLFRVFKDIVTLRRYHKTPREILRYLKCENMDFFEAEQVLSKRTAVNVKIFVSPYAEMGVDIDKASDYELAKIYFKEMLQRHYENKQKKHLGSDFEAHKIEE